MVGERDDRDPTRRQQQASKQSKQAGRVKVNKQLSGRTKERQREADRQRERERGRQRQTADQ